VTEGERIHDRLNQLSCTYDLSIKRNGPMENFLRGEEELLLTGERQLIREVSGRSSRAVSIRPPAGFDPSAPSSRADRKGGGVGIEGLKEAGRGEGKTAQAIIPAKELLEKSWSQGRRFY